MTSAPSMICPFIIAPLPWGPRLTQDVSGKLPLFGVLKKRMSHGVGQEILRLTSTMEKEGELMSPLKGVGHVN